MPRKGLATRLIHPAAPPTDDDQVMTIIVKKLTLICQSELFRVQNKPFNNLKILNL